MEEVVISRTLQENIFAIFGGYTPRRRRITADSFTKVEYRHRSKRNKIVTARYDNLSSFVVLEYLDKDNDEQQYKEILMDIDTLLDLDDYGKTNTIVDCNSSLSSGFDEISTISDFSNCSFGSEYTTSLSEIYNLLSGEKSEELLTDVLYSVQSLMGATGGGVWSVGGGIGVAQTHPQSCVTMDQVKQVLQTAFQVTPENMDRISQDVQSRPVPEVSLHLNLKEAKDLRAKTVKGTTNPYVTIINPSTGQSHRTRLEKDTLNPKWNQEFILRLHNLQKDVIHLEVWHEHDAVTVKQLTAVRDIRGLGRLMKGTTAQAQHHASHLLGQINMNVKDVSRHGIVEDWYPLEKKDLEVGQNKVGGDVSREKERGTLRITACVSSSAAQLGRTDSRSYDSLLAHLIHHHVAATNNNNEQENNWSKPLWPGKVSGPAAAALAQFAITLELSDAAVQLSWWRIGSQVSSADPDWILYQLHQVQAALGKGAYKGETLTELQVSLASYVRNCIEKLKDLQGAFPPASGVHAPQNLKSTLKILQAMQSHLATRCLLDQEDFPHLQELVSTALSEHTKCWWRSVIEEQLQGVRTADEQINKVINIVAEAHTFLALIADFYNPVIIKEMNINYMQTAYLSVSNKISPCVRPLIMNIYNRMPTGGAQITENSDDGKYALEVGTSLWQLYRNLGRLHALGVCLPADLKVESGVREYHRWFSRGVMRWLELAVLRAQTMIMRAVELDSLEPVDAYFNFSSSATDTIGIFLDVKNWWVKLAWPDPENSAVLLTKILEDVCSCGTQYSDLVREKVQLKFHQENSSRVFITKQICVGLNSIERVREELTKLPEHFEFERLLEEVRQGESGSGAVAARQLEATVERLIFSAAENMESKVNEFVETVIGKMQITLENAVNEACDSQSPTPLLSRTLDPTLDILQSHLNSSNFDRFLCRTWEVILQSFHSNVMRNAERRRPNYFGGVYNILEATLNFFSPGDGKGLDRQAAQTHEYTSVLELLESLRKTTESVICQYYRERYEEQVDEILPAKAQLVVKLLFTRSGKLIVEVIMARDMVVEGETGSIGSSHRGFHHHHEPIDSYVKVQPVPAEWFPTIPIRKTKTLRRQDPAVYEETFEYEMSQQDDGVSEGFLLLTLKDYNLGRTNTFIGEAVVPLSSLPCVDSSKVYTVPNTYLKMTTPGLDIGYKSLRALQFRTGDKTATSFLKKVSKRLLDSKAKNNSPLKPEDEKAGSKSPAFRERLKFS
ncbi:hypothetical protein Pmani_013827 [Petrolisthes manimaculis]|uniref:Uncharacterized protein n=1 Tax=Petrolisthes manimaculis TaxID=1843537 RepID=A0AAE1U8Z6_9EUCA|nr:hypothetical protein Pmani_013827 [Petrolisthes manimaculis]